MAYKQPKYWPVPWQQSGNGKVVSPSHPKNLTASLAWPGPGAKPSVPSAFMSSPSGKLLTEISSWPQLPTGAPSPCWYVAMQSVGQGELASLDLHKQIAHWETIQLILIAFKLDYFTWSFGVSCKSFMGCISYILRWEGLLVSVCFMEGGHVCGEANSRMQRHFRIIAAHCLQSAGTVKWNWNGPWISSLWRETCHGLLRTLNAPRAAPLTLQVLQLLSSPPGDA